jgi:DNA-binding MurR/RpiR family transcriptional regulator
LIKVVPDPAIFPQAGETFGEHFAAMHPGDLVICIAPRRRMANTTPALQELHQIGVTSALMTDDARRLSSLYPVCATSTKSTNV